MKRFVTLLLVLLAIPCLAQNAARYDAPPLSTIPGAPNPGALPPLLAIPGAQISVCAYPASGNPCTNTITTYTDSTLTTACAAGTPLTLAGTSTCTQYTDSQGNYGFWYNTETNAHIQYTVKTSWGNFGPYDVMPPGSGGAAAGTSGCVQIAGISSGTFGCDTSFVNNSTTHTVSQDFIQAISGFKFPVAGAVQTAMQNGQVAPGWLSIFTNGYTAENCYGDSYGVGVGTTSGTEGMCYWTALNGLGSTANLTNYAVGGYTSCDIANLQVFQHANPGASVTYATVIGNDLINDYVAAVGYVGSSEINSKENLFGTTLPYADSAIKCAEGMMTWASTPSTLKYTASSFSTPPTGWTDDSASYAAVETLQTTTPSSTVSLPVTITAAAGGTPTYASQSIVLWYEMNNANGPQDYINVQIQSVSSTYCSTQILATYNIPTMPGTGTLPSRNSVTRTLVPFIWTPTGTTAACPYNVIVTTSPTETGTIRVAGAGVSLGPLATTTSPQVWGWTTPYQLFDQQTKMTARWNSISKRVFYDMQNAGFPVFAMDTRQCVDASTNYMGIANAAPPYHMYEPGYEAMANCMLLSSSKMTYQPPLLQTLDDSFQLSTASTTYISPTTRRVYIESLSAAGAALLPLASGDGPTNATNVGQGTGQIITIYNDSSYPVSVNATTPNTLGIGAAIVMPSFSSLTVQNFAGSNWVSLGTGNGDNLNWGILSNHTAGYTFTGTEGSQEFTCTAACVATLPTTGYTVTKAIFVKNNSTTYSVSFTGASAGNTAKNYILPGHAGFLTSQTLGTWDYWDIGGDLNVPITAVGINGWGTGQTYVINNSVSEHKVRFTITAGSTGTPIADPYFVITFPQSFLQAPSCTAQMTGGTGTIEPITSGTETTTSTGTMTYQGTAVLTDTYQIDVSCNN